jgi:hypothetical protein
MSIMRNRNQFEEQADSTIRKPACSFTYMPNMPQIYKGHVKVKTRQAKRIAGAANSN